MKLIFAHLIMGYDIDLPVPGEEAGEYVCRDTLFGESECEDSSEGGGLSCRRLGLGFGLWDLRGWWWYMRLIV